MRKASKKSGGGKERERVEKGADEQNRRTKGRGKRWQKRRETD